MDITNVAELIGYTIENNTLILGANTTLTSTMTIFDSLSKRRGFAYLAQMSDHLDLVAHVPVRNVSEGVETKVYWLNKNFCFVDWYVSWKFDDQTQLPPISIRYIPSLGYFQSHHCHRYTILYM